ncbi:MAG: hypothetical protein AAGC60_24495 [Acidobacteriota bacterium]
MQPARFVPRAAAWLLALSSLFLPGAMSAESCDNEPPFVAGANAVDLLEYFLPAAENRGKIIRTRNGETFQTVRLSIPGDRFTERMHLVKNADGSNYEVYAYDDDWIYHLRDTSWAAEQGEDFLDVPCLDGSGTAQFTLLNTASPGASNPENPCTIGNLQSLLATDEGGRWVPRYMAQGDVFRDCRTIVSINEETCACCDTGFDGVNLSAEFTLRSIGPETFTLDGGIPFTVDVIKLEVTGGAGAGDKFIYGKGWGLLGFENPLGVDNNVPKAIFNGFQTARQPTCRPQGCTDACTACVLEEIPSIIDVYLTSGRDLSCGGGVIVGGGLNQDVVEDWCTNLSSEDCQSIETGACAAECACEPDCDPWYWQSDSTYCGPTFHRWQRFCRTGEVGIWQQTCSNEFPGTCNDAQALPDGGCQASCQAWTAHPDSDFCGALTRWQRACFGNGASMLETVCASVAPSATCGLGTAGPSVQNAGLEDNGTQQFGFLGSWGPNGAWAFHAQFPADDRQGLGERFGYYSAGTTETVGQQLGAVFQPNTTYVFRSHAIGGGKGTGTVPYQIGWVGSDGSFQELETRLINLDGNTAWEQTLGVQWTTGGSGPELGERIFLRFGPGTIGGRSDIWFDDIELLVMP